MQIFYSFKRRTQVRKTMDKRVGWEILLFTWKAKFLWSYGVD